MPSPTPSAAPATTPIHGGGVTITIPPQVVPALSALSRRAMSRWRAANLSSGCRGTAASGALGTIPPRGKAPPNATRIDMDHKTFSLNPAFVMNVRVAVHPLGPKEPPYPPSYDEEGERNALRLLANSAYINPLRLPVTVRQRAARRTPALIYQDDNESWRCVGCAKCHPRCLALSVCGTLIPEGEWRHAGKHQCSRCHARDRAGVPADVPAPAISRRPRLGPA